DDVVAVPDLARGDGDVLLHVARGARRRERRVARVALEAAALPRRRDVRIRARALLGTALERLAVRIAAAARDDRRELRHDPRARGIGAAALHDDVTFAREPWRAERRDAAREILAAGRSARHERRRRVRRAVAVVAFDGDG